MLTVLFATKNRAGLLARVLESFATLESPRGGWKLIVVDNGSTDETQGVLRSFSERLPLTVIVEMTPGKNSALNTGLRSAEGDLFAFTDDDAFPRSDWLVQLRSAADAHSDFQIFAGAIVPRWEVPPPAWVNWIEPGPVFTLTDPAASEGPIPAYAVYGPNMAIRSSAFHAGLQFNPEIGPRGANYAMGSETELLDRLDERGCKAWFVTGAIVEHFVRETQLHSDWVMKRGIRYGRGQFRLRHVGELSSRRLLFGVPRYLFRELYRETRARMMAFLRFDRKASFQAQWRIQCLRGTIREARVLSREPITPATSSSHA